MLGSLQVWRYIDLEYDELKQTYNVQILTPSTTPIGLRLLPWFLSYQVLRTSIRDGMLENIAVQVSVPLSKKDAVFGLEDFLRARISP